MAKCVKCGKNGADYPHHEGGYVCSECLGSFFTCPDCGEVFENSGYEAGDAGNGFCANCAPNH